ncbi:MAG TPA: NHLP leader peptide family RiPP precursor [Coleofasciculaceae cyanobacterium]|jgi:hypothetical protein
MSENHARNINRYEFETELITRAWQNEEFKQKLIDNPKAIYAEELQQKLPQNIEIKTIEETANSLYLVLPQNPAEIKVSEELSEEALESVAGGGVIGGVLIRLEVI